MARPTKYTKDTPKKVEDYLEDYKWDGDIIPSIEGLADYLNVGKNTLYDWASHESKVEFSNALDKVRNKQARMLFTNGLTGDYNATLAKLMLHHHGYSDKTETTLNVKSHEDWADELE